MAKTFGLDERRIKAIISVGTTFIFRGSKYTVLKSGKPTCHKGEPKTDIYVLAGTDNGACEFKISYKKDNADFIENKMNAERAELLLGSDWKNIITNSTSKIKNAFLYKPLIYKVKKGRTDKGAFTLGWKFELLNKSNGEFSAKINLTKSQVIDVYAGTNLPEEKRNALVNGEVIENSGIANYVLFGNDFSDINDVFDNLLTVEEYIEKYPDVFFACKALNYRSARKKWDGDRPLSVFVEWTVKNGKLTSKLRFDQPLITKGNTVAHKLIDALNELKIQTDEDINLDNVADYSTVAE